MMTKRSANTIYPVIDLIKDRFSPRIFDNKEVKDEELLTMIEAGCWAASGYNEQPWRYIIARKGGDSWQKIFDSLDEWNQGWADSAPVFILCVAKKMYSHIDSLNPFNKYDLGQAVANMAIQGVSQQIHMRQVGTFEAEKCNETFEIPKDYESVICLAVGYPGDANNLKEEYKKLELSARTRLSLSEVVFNGSWGESYKK